MSFKIIKIKNYGHHISKKGLSKRPSSTENILPKMPLLCKKKEITCQLFYFSAVFISVVNPKSLVTVDMYSLYFI